MNTKQPIQLSFKTCMIMLLVFATLSCKKPRNGNYTYEETGTRKIYLKENSDPFVLQKLYDISTSEKVRVKNKKDVLSINSVIWDIKGDSAINRGNTSSVTSPNQSFKSHYSYCGLITGKKSIEGTFSRVQIIISYSNTTVDSSSGTLRYIKN